MNRSEKVEAYFAEEHHYKKAIGFFKGFSLKNQPRGNV